MGVEIDPELKRQLISLQPRLRRFALGLVGNLDEADELVQSTYERALSRLEQWERGTRLDSWMFRILQNLWLNQLRAAKVRRTSEEVGPDDLGGLHEENRWMAGLMLERVKVCLQRLPDDQRAALVLVAVEGLPYKEAAKVMGLPVGTLTSRLGRARKALQLMLEGDDGPGLGQGRSIPEPGVRSKP